MRKLRYELDNQFSSNKFSIKNEITKLEFRKFSESHSKFKKQIKQLRTPDVQIY